MNNKNASTQMELLPTIISEINNIRIQLLDITSSTRDYFIADKTTSSMYDKLNIKIQKKNKLDTIIQLMEFANYLFKILMEYNEFIDILLSENYLSAIKYQTSDTYSKAYVQKCNIIKNKIKDLDKNLVTFFTDKLEPMSFKGVDMTSLSKERISFTKLLSFIGTKLTNIGDEKYNISNFTDNMLLPLKDEPVTGRAAGSGSCDQKLPLTSMGLDFNLVPTNTKLTIEEINNIKKVFKILINNNTVTAKGTVFYNLDKIIDPKLKEYKKVMGINVDLLNLLNSIQYTVKPAVRTLPKEHCPGITYIKESGPIRLYETEDGINYSSMKLYGNADIYNMNYGNISLGPKNSVKFYNKITDVIIQDNLSTTGMGTRSDTMIIDELKGREKLHYLDLLDYREKNVDEIFNLYKKTHPINKEAVVSKAITEERALMDIYRATMLEGQVYKTRHLKEPLLPDINSAIDTIT